MTKWVDTLGGPHLLLPEYLLDVWRGGKCCVDPIDLADPSDYARACQIRTWIGSIPVGSGTALVFSGDVGPIAWMPSTMPNHGYFVQWVGIDDEALISPALQTAELARLFAAPDAETLEFEVLPPGNLILFDSVESGGEIRSCLRRLQTPLWLRASKPIDYIQVALSPGRYMIRTGYFEAPGIMMAVREVLPLAVAESKERPFRPTSH
jgi:hypothetical protein